LLLAAVVKKLTNSERLVQEQMLAMLEWASDRPDMWHKIGNQDGGRAAVEARRD